MNRNAYCYIKGLEYNVYKFYYEGDDNFKEIEKTFDTLEELIDYAIKFSDLYSISIQFYR